jgi:hypothetical protein
VVSYTNINVIRSAMRNCVAHGFLRDPHEVRFCFVAKSSAATVACERTGGLVDVMNNTRQGLKPVGQTLAVHSDRAETTGEVTDLADRLLQESDDLVRCRGRDGLLVRRQGMGKRRAQGYNSGK